MRKINLAGIILLTGGIAIGIALTMISMHAVGRATTTANHSSKGDRANLIAEKATQSPPGAADAQTPQEPPPAAQPEETQSVEQPATQAPADWLKPEDLVKQNAQSANGAAPSAVPAPKYQSSHTEYYIYPTGPTGAPAGAPMEMTSTVSGYPVPVGSGLKAVDYQQTGPVPWTVGENGLMQNPCVDPPSCRGRAYRH